MQLNQTQMADVLGVSPSTLAGWRDKPDFPQPAKEGRELIYDSARVIAWLIVAANDEASSRSSGTGVLAALGILGGRDALYKTGRLMGDVNAVAKGKVGRRIGRRLAGKMTGGLLRKLFG